MHTSNERGIAMITTLLVMMLISALLVGFTAVVISDQRFRFIDRDRSQAFYGASAGIEKLTADLGNLFFSTVAPTAAQVQALATNPPSITGVSFTKGDGSTGYQIAAAAAVPTNITTGPYAGLLALMTSYTIDVTARTTTGGEVHLTRQTETVAIPVFQFGMFSDVDLSFFAGPNFGFGGRVHTNGNLYLAQGNGTTLTINDKVTAVGEVVRQELSNGSSIDAAPAHAGTVSITKGGNAFLALDRAKGSVLAGAGPGKVLNDPTWHTVSLSDFNGYIRNGRTGATALNLPLLTVGGTNPDLVRRPPTNNENVTNNVLYNERDYTKVSLRILLSDTANEITQLPGLSAGAPVSLEAGAGVWPPAGYVAGGSPIATSNGVAPNLTPNNTSLIGGFIKIDKQDNNGVWTDVTMEILNLGIASRNLARGGCVDPDANAVIRIERLKDNGAACAGNAAYMANANNYWDQKLFDPREGLNRDLAAGIPAGNALRLGGVMSYVSLDVNNLRRWFAGNIGATGANALNNNGYGVYFSDRRNNKNANGVETAEYGWEDIVNRGTAAGTPDGLLDPGEDVNANGVLDTYGQFPRFVNNVGNLSAAARPYTTATPAEAQQSRQIFFRRALKLTNGALGNLPMPGLTVVSENPVYVEGDYNANQAGFNGNNAAASIIADTVTLLSNNWNDNMSFASPYSTNGALNTNGVANRVRPADSYYRVAIIGGKNPSFPIPTAFVGMQSDFGTDGGAHNFLRMLESGGTVHYRGAIATFFYSRQGTGFYKSTAAVYTAPTRDFQFDLNFLNPAQLPPLTPVFRDLNTVGFSQELRPGR